MYCGVCGRKTDKLFLSEIEGARIEVCEQCTSSGKVIKRIKESVKPKKEARREEIEIIREIVPDYADIIKRVHQQSGLKREDFAKKINEKESLVKKIELGEMEPSLKLAEKLERMFKIKLIETREVRPETAKSQQYKESADITLGDIVDFKK